MNKRERDISPEWRGGMRSMNLLARMNNHPLHSCFEKNKIKIVGTQKVKQTGLVSKRHVHA